MKYKITVGRLTAWLLSLCMCIGIMAPSAVLKAYAAESGISDLWVSFSAESDSKAIDSINWYNDSGTYYLFLPSHASLDKAYISFTASQEVYLTCSSAGISDLNLTSGGQTDILKKLTGRTSTLSCAGYNYALYVMQSDTVPAMYITTESGNLDYIHQSKENKEKGNIKVVTADGAVDCESDLSSIKGRGNATWYDFDKKPYNIKFKSKTNLLGMGSAKGWCLIANAGDRSHLRHKIAYEAATAGGIEFCSDSRYVDLYINNNYMGTYLVTEKVDIGKTSVDIQDLEGATEDVNDADLDSYERMGETSGSVAGTKKWYDIPNDPDDITGGYLLEFELNDRYPNEASGFVTTRNQSVVLKYPEYASEAQVNYISKLFQDMENAVYSETGYNSKKKHYSEYLDIESFAKMYVIQEFAANLDVAITSFFVYKESDLYGDGKFHAAPVWDFDNAFGASSGRYGYDLRKTDVDWTENGYIYNFEGTPHLFNALYHQSDGLLVDSVIYEWFHNFKSIMNDIENNPNCEYSVEYLSKLTDGTLAMNSVRWNTQVDRDTVKNYISKRNVYFNNKYAVMNNIKSCTVTGLEDQPFLGTAVTPEPVVTNCYGRVLLLGRDYKLEYTNNDKIGTASVTVIGTGSFSSELTCNFNIVNADISNAKVEYTGSFNYTGKQIKPKVALAAPYDNLVQDVDYTVSYSDNINAGTGKITITGIGNFSGMISCEFKINPIDINSVVVSGVKSAVYTGKKIKQNITVTALGGTLVSGKDYSVSYSGNKNAGTAKITIKGTGNFSGSRTVSFTIKPKKVKGLKTSSKLKKTVTVKFKKTGGAKKYIVLYSRNKSFKNAKKKIVKVTSVKLKKLKSGKKYYIKVRAYAGGVSGSYSARRAVRVK